MCSKLILVDIDDTVLNWEYAFHTWMEHYAHEPVVIDQGLFEWLSDQYALDNNRLIRLIKRFNASEAIGFLPPFRDAIQYIRLLYQEHGYKFHAITSVGDSDEIKLLRHKNLYKLFGKVFEHIECLPMAGSKEEYLTRFKDSGYYWIENNITNAELGVKLGLKSILMEHGYSMDYQNADIVKVRSWKEVYQLIIHGKILDKDDTYFYTNLNGENEG